jgi:hypothetical protein
MASLFGGMQRGAHAQACTGVGWTGNCNADVGADPVGGHFDRGKIVRVRMAWQDLAILLVPA